MKWRENLARVWAWVRQHKLWVGLGCGAGLPLLYFAYVAFTLPELAYIPQAPSTLYSKDSVVLARLQPENYAPWASQKTIPHLLFKALEAAEGTGRHIVNPFAYRLVKQAQPGISSLRAAVAALFIQSKTGQDSLLTLYLNRAAFGGPGVGVVNGARYYFNTMPDSLLPEQSALLAGLLKGPTYYNPYRYPKRALARRNEVLVSLVKNNMLKKNDCNILTNKELNTKHGELKTTHITAPYFVAEVARRLDEWAATYNKQNHTHLNIRTAGLQIYTTLDTHLQTHAEQAVLEQLQKLQARLDAETRWQPPWKKDTTILERARIKTPRYLAAKAAHKSRGEIRQLFGRKVHTQVLRIKKVGQDPSNIELRAVQVDTLISPEDSLKYSLRMLQAALLSVDPQTGGVRAWVGGTNYAQSPLDHISQTERQVGSAFKPFVYLAALDNGLKPCDELKNIPFAIQTPEGPWVPRNAEGESASLLSLRCALAFSINIVTARLIDKLGPALPIRYAHLAGISKALKPVPSIAFGTTDLSVLELTTAYTTLANGGATRPLELIRRIADATGKTMLDRQSPLKPVLNPLTTYTVLDMLRDVTTYGTAGNIKRDFGLYGIDLAGKTGTTQGHADGWFMSLTPELVTGVWVGCDDRNVHFQSMTSGRGAVTAMPLGGRFLQRAYTDREIKLPHGKFKVPERLGPIACAKCPPMKTPQDVGSDNPSDSTQMGIKTDSLKKAK